jgi:hypothetical protein
MCSGVLPSRCGVAPYAPQYVTYPSNLEQANIPEVYMIRALFQYIIE